MKRIFFFLSLFFSFAVFSQQSLTPVQIAERNKPGTVMILVSFKGTVRITEPVPDKDAIQALGQDIKQKIADGALTEDQFWNTYIVAFCKDISKCMMKGNDVIERQLNTTMVGSGFIVTPDGYVITNCHVVDENDEATKQNFILETFQKIIDDDLESMEKTMGRSLTDAEAQLLKDANAWYFKQTMEVGDITKEFRVVLGITGDKGKIVPLAIPAELKVKGEPIPGKDVAILKLTEKHIYPTIRIGDDKAMRVGEQVYVLGYPAVATFNPLISEESISEATLTQGLVSAKKNMKGGWEVLQIDAAITHGNSGGPVMNGSGEVIGLATFVSVDEQRKQEVQGMNFIVPSTIVNEFIDQAKIKPEMSDISLAYEEAMNLFDQSRYKKALEKFREVKSMNNSFPFIDSYLADAQTKINKGLDKEPHDRMMYYYIGGGVLVLVLILVLALRRRK
jgi:serine protease Do